MRCVLLLLDPPKTWGEIFMWLGALALAVGVIWYGFRKGNKQADAETIATWKNLAESRKASNEELTRENALLTATVKEQRGELEACEKFRQDVGQQFLRFEAREEKYQLCINRLERRLGIEETDFSDPIPQHTT